MGARIRAFDWSSHPLGPPAGWPATLQTAISLCLDSTFPTCVYWGQESWVLSNDAWAPVPADKHPGALGRPRREVWADITERSRAEAALRITNWQLGEERARLAATVEAEQRAQQALRRFTGTLEAQVRSRTAGLSRALAAQSAVADRLRATFQTELIYRGFVNAAGVLLDANKAALAAIRAQLHEVAGKPLWDTALVRGHPWRGDAMRAAVQATAAGQTVRQELKLQLPIGRRRFDLTTGPVFNAKGELAGLVPEGVDITDTR